MEKAKPTERKQKGRVGQNVFLACVCEYKSTKVTRIPQLLQVPIHISNSSSCERRLWCWIAFLVFQRQPFLLPKTIPSYKTMDLAQQRGAK